MKTHPEFANIAEGATTADLYNRAVEIGASGDEHLARRYFLALVEHILQYSIIPNMSRERAEGVAFTNIEYWLKHHEVDPVKVKSVYLRIMGTFRTYSYEEMWDMYMSGWYDGSGESVPAGMPPDYKLFQDHIHDNDDTIASHEQEDTDPVTGSGSTPVRNL
jgi:hypothetical protein